MIITPAPLEWAFQHFQVIGWPTLCLVAWKLSGFIQDVEARAITVETAVHKMSVNCFPTMQASLQNQDRLLGEMNDSLKTIAQQTNKISRKK
jgi:hypothetical protein